MSCLDAGAHRTRDERAVEPASEHFSGLVFKLQVLTAGLHPFLKNTVVCDQEERGQLWYVKEVVCQGILFCVGQ